MPSEQVFKPKEEIIQPTPVLEKIKEEKPEKQEKLEEAIPVQIQKQESNQIDIEHLEHIEDHETP